MIIFRWKSRDGSRRQAVRGGKSKIGLSFTKARNFATRSNRRLGRPNDEYRKTLNVEIIVTHGFLAKPQRSQRFTYPA